MLEDKALVLLSGGMDSTTLLYEVLSRGVQAEPVFIDYGSKHNRKEWKAVQEICKVNNLNGIGLNLGGLLQNLFKSDLLEGQGEIPEGHYEDQSMKRTVVPFRNGILLSLATGLAESRGAKSVYYAAHGGDHAIYPDCREEFFEPMQKAAYAGTYLGIELRAPFLGIKKHDVATIGKRLGVPYEMTWSCYKGEEKHCGKCGTCVERKEAFKLANMEDPTEYASN